MSLGRFLVRRLLLSLLVLLGSSIMIFVIARIIPGNPARLALGEKATQEAVDRLSEEMHLNDPWYIQYGYWILGVFQGDLGDSLNTKRPVIDDVKDFLPATLELVLFSSVFIVLFAVLFGRIATRYRNRWPDTVIRVCAYIGVAMPGFVLATLFVLVFGAQGTSVSVLGRLTTGITVERVTGFMLIDTLLAGDLYAFKDAFFHLLLPALALACAPMFSEARIIRSAMLDNMNKDYLIAHKGYGIPNSLVMRKYLLKPSLIPAISTLGLDIAALAGNAFLVEMIFAWPGISRYGTQAILNKDLNAISAVILIFGILFIIINIIVDVVVSILDPRIRLGGS